VRARRLALARAEPLSRRSLRDALIGLVAFPGWAAEDLKPCALALLSCARGRAPAGSEGAVIALERALGGGDGG